MFKQFYLAASTTDLNTATFHILHRDEAERFFAVGEDQLLDQGFMVAESLLTGSLVLVRPLKNKKFSKAWNKWITEFEAFDVDTTATVAGVLTATKGRKRACLKAPHAALEILA